MSWGCQLLTIVNTLLQILHVYWAIRQNVLTALITYITEWHAIDNYNYHFLEKITCFAFRILTLISLLFENSNGTESKTITNRKNVLIAISTFFLQGLQLYKNESMSRIGMKIKNLSSESDYMISGSYRNVYQQSIYPYILPVD
jgi:hypothetical protein